MKLSTVIVGLLLAFLLFTPQGQTLASVAAELAMYEAKQASTPAPVPPELAAKTAKEKEWAACVRDWKARASAPGLPSGYRYTQPDC
jgi:hypothetical protein